MIFCQCNFRSRRSISYLRTTCSIAKCQLHVISIFHVCNKSFPNQSPKIFNKNIYEKTIINMIKKNGDAFSRTDRKNGAHNWSVSLFLCCFTSHLRIFRSYSDVRGCKTQHLGLHARRDLYRATSVVTGPSVSAVSTVGPPHLVAQGTRGTIQTGMLGR